MLGLKYVDLNFGHSSKVFPDGATMPVAQTNVPVQFDDIDTMFDARTRPAIEQNLAGYGDALTARGSALNDTIASLPALFQHLQPVAKYLSDPRHRADPLLRVAERVLRDDLPGRADQRAAVRRPGDDVRGDLAQRLGPREHDQGVAADARRLDELARGPAAVPRPT